MRYKYRQPPLLSIDNRHYSGPVVAELIGEKELQVFIPYRDPKGPVIVFRDGVIHHLTCDVFDVADGQGAIRKSEMRAIQATEIKRRAATAHPVDVQQMLSDAADLSPVQHNAPATWSFGVIDKGGFLGAPISEAEAQAQDEAKMRENIAEFIAVSTAGKREAAAVTAGLSSAT